MTGTIELLPVDSKLATHIGYDPATNTLAVRYHGGKEYHYSDFTAQHYKALRAAPSLGKHISTTVKGKFPHRMLS